MNHIKHIIEKIKTEELYGLSEKSEASDTRLESPIEEKLYLHLDKYRLSEVELIPQYDISTVSGNFRIDLVLKSESRIIGIECDGEEFHSKEMDVWYDDWRDDLIIMFNQVDCVYRFKGRDIFENIADLIYFLAINEPSLFNKSIKRLRPLVRKETLSTSIIDILDSRGIYYDHLDEKSKWHTRFISIRQRSKKRYVDIRHVLYSYIYPDKKIPELIKILVDDSRNGRYHQDVELIKLYNEKYPDYQISVD